MTGAILRSAGLGATVATLGLAGALVYGPFDRAAAGEGYVLLLGGIGLAVLVRATTGAASSGAAGSPFEQALRAPAQPVERPPELARLEREVYLAVGSAFYAHYRLRPLLREVAAHRLHERRGVDLADVGPGALEGLPAQALELLREDRPPPRDPHAPGIPLATLRAIVDALERIPAR